MNHVKSRLYKTRVTVDKVSTAESENTFININLCNLELPEIEIDKRTTFTGFPERLCPKFCVNHNFQ